MTVNAVFFCSYKDVGKIPSDGLAQIAFAGRSNVGKSTLLNRLVNQKKLAKTSKTPGRTRLMNFFLINEAYYFVDLPGYGFAKASKKDRNEWGRMVESYFQARKNLNGLILLLDCRREPNDDDLMLINWLQTEKIEFTIALTKADKLSKSKLMGKVNAIKKDFGIEPIPFSSLSGIGRIELWKWINKTVATK